MWTVPTFRVHAMKSAGCVIAAALCQTPDVRPHRRRGGDDADLTACGYENETENAKNLIAIPGESVVAV